MKQVYTCDVNHKTYYNDSYRATKWSLQELECKYNVAMERTVILESEVSEKAALVEDVQRLKDELRGTTDIACKTYNVPSLRHLGICF